jgi:hypothetical protein
MQCELKIAIWYVSFLALSSVAKGASNRSDILSRDDTILVRKYGPWAARKSGLTGKSPSYTLRSTVLSGLPCSHRYAMTLSTAELPWFLTPITW